ncbi:glutathione S-transferase family protein [Duganella callida]|uniref:Glutathione S-transferase family protein n=1 Tax=Duganella callida TaxID=2561932 RepID=A0A4Y9SBI2_9BURK|nr:glutathione S-transferase family protein [Duganella callida]TFW18000.1 glutathione S-transferase family protein [Duganella callida]
MSLTLYYHPLASFCHKVLIALYENGTQFEKRIINLGEEADRAELESIWPLCKFPVLRDHTPLRDVPETSIIIEYLDQHHPGAQLMIPQNRDDALDVRLWDRFFDNYVQEPMQTIVNAHLTGMMCDQTKERTKLKTAYKMIERRMATRSWMCGEAFSLADCAAAPALFYAHTLLPFPEEYHHLQSYFERLVTRPSVKQVLDEAKPYFSMYPFAKDIPERFL